MQESSLRISQTEELCIKPGQLYRFFPRTDQHALVYKYAHDGPVSERKLMGFGDYWIILSITEYRGLIHALHVNSSKYLWITRENLLAYMTLVQDA